MIIELPGFDFENLHPNSLAIDSLFDKVVKFLDMKGINRIEYSLGNQITAGLGQIVIRKVNDFWLLYTTERETNFDIGIFSNEYHAINYFIFRLTGGKETIDWSSI